MIDNWTRAALIMLQARGIPEKDTLGTLRAGLIILAASEDSDEAGEFCAYLDAPRPSPAPHDAHARGSAASRGTWTSPSTTRGSSGRSGARRRTSTSGGRLSPRRCGAVWIASPAR